MELYTEVCAAVLQASLCIFLHFMSGESLSRRICVLTETPLSPCGQTNASEKLPCLKLLFVIERDLHTYLTDSRGEFPCCILVPVRFVHLLLMY